MQIKMVISRPLIHSRQNNKDGSNKQQKYFWKIAFLRHLTLQSIHLAWSNFGPIHLRQRVFLQCSVHKTFIQATALPADRGLSKD